MAYLTKSIWRGLAFSIISSFSLASLAGVMTTFVPLEPTVESPLDGAADVSKTPRLESNLASAVDSNDTSPWPVNLERAEWIVYETENNVRFAGGAILENVDFSGSAKEFAFPISGVMLNGREIKHVGVNQVGGVWLSNVDHYALARIHVQPTYFNEIASSDNNALVAVFNNDDVVIVQWYQKNAEGAAQAWESTIEAIITKEGLLGIRMSDNSLTSSIYTLAGGEVGCSMLTGNNYPGPMTSVIKTLPEWKTLLQGASQTEFSLSCTLTPDGSQFDLSPLMATTPFTLPTPQIKHLSSDAVSLTVSEQDQLMPGRTYYAQVRHVVKNVDDMSEQPFTQTSAWSDPVSFTTVAPQVSFEVALPQDLVFVKDEAKQVQFTVKNNGPDIASPVVELRLPLDFTQVINGSLSDFFAADINGVNCPVRMNNGQTILSCSLDQLAVNASLNFNALITLNDTTINQVEYRVCNQACDLQDYTPVDVSVIEARNNPSNNGSNTEESGGALFALYALIALLRRRYSY